MQQFAPFPIVETSRRHHQSAVVPFRHFMLRLARVFIFSPFWGLRRDCRHAPLRSIYPFKGVVVGWLNRIALETLLAYVLGPQLPVHHG